MKRKTLRTLVLAATVALGLCRSAQSVLRVDLRVTSVEGPAIVHNSQSVLVMGMGARINMDIWAQIIGSNANSLDDGLISLSGSVVSDHVELGYLRGTISAELVSAFTAAGSSVGLQQDLDGDGDLDVGSNNDSDPANFFAARALSAPNPVAGSEVRIGRASFTADSVATSGAAFAWLYFRPRYNPLAAAWIEDGVVHTPASNAFAYGYGVGVSALPEPGPLGVLAAVATFASALRPQRRAS